MMYGYGNSMFLFNNGIIATPASNPLWDSLYAVYKAESNANDELGTYNGTGYGGLTYSTGVDGNAFIGNGTNAYVGLPNNSMNISGDISVSFWVYLTSAPAASSIISTYWRTSPFTVYYGWSILMLSDKVTFDTYNGINATNERVQSSAIGTGAWKHVAVMYEEGVSTSIYINGSLSSSGATTTSIGYSGNETPAMLGVQAGSGLQYPLNGKQDEIYIWNRLITPTEVTELYNSGSGTFY